MRDSNAKSCRAYAYYMATLCTFLNLTGVYAQVTTHEALYWTRYYNQVTFNPKISWHNEFDNRRTIKPDLKSQFIYHTHVHYRIKPWIDVAVGLSYSQVNRSPKLVQPEIRPFQEVNIEKKFAKDFRLQFRFRVDDRFIHDLNPEKTGLAKSSSFNWRYRFRLSLSYPLIKKDNRQIIAKLSDEYMFQSGDKITRAFDQNRIYGGIEWQPNKKLGVEVGYMFAWQGKGAMDFLQRDIGRLTLYHRIVLPQKS